MYCLRQMLLGTKIIYDCDSNQLKNKRFPSKYTFKRLNVSILCEEKSKWKAIKRKHTAIDRILQKQKPKYLFHFFKIQIPTDSNGIMSSNAFAFNFHSRLFIGDSHWNLYSCDRYLWLVRVVTTYEFIVAKIAFGFLGILFHFNFCSYKFLCECVLSHTCYTPNYAQKQLQFSIMIIGTFHSCIFAIRISSQTLEL